MITHYAFEFYLLRQLICTPYIRITTCTVTMRFLSLNDLEIVRGEIISQKYTQSMTKLESEHWGISVVWWIPLMTWTIHQTNDKRRFQKVMCLLGFFLRNSTFYQIRCHRRYFWVNNGTSSVNINTSHICLLHSSKRAATPRPPRAFITSPAKLSDWMASALVPQDNDFL